MPIRLEGQPRCDAALVIRIRCTHRTRRLVNGRPIKTLGGQTLRNRAPREPCPRPVIRPQPRARPIIKNPAPSTLSDHARDLRARNAMRAQIAAHLVGGSNAPPGISHRKAEAASLVIAL